MNVIIYGRVSTENQEYDGQLSTLKETCRFKGWNIVGVFSEKVSGTKTSAQRKELNKLLVHVKNTPDIQGVLVTELSRIGRNTIDVLNTIEKLTNLRIWLYSQREGITTLKEDGTRDPNANLILTFLSGVAQLERDLITSRSLNGLRHNTENLKRWVGGSLLPYGYKRVNKKLEIDEEESEVVKLIFRLYLDGYGTKKIANKLNEMKIPTRYNKSLKKEGLTINNNYKKKEDFNWKDGTIYGILTNEVYIGEKKGKKKIEGIKLYSPSIIEKSEFDKVQKGLKAKQIKRETKFTYYFQNKLSCGRCGRTYFPHKRTPTDPNKVSRDNRYICLSKRYSESCDNYGISISKLRDAVWSVLRNNRDEIRNILELNSENVLSIEEKIRNLQEQIKEVDSRLKDLNRQEKKLADLYLSDSISESVYQLKFKEIKRDTLKNEQLINDLEDELSRKIDFKKKQANVNVQLRNIKENRLVFKRTIDAVINRILIYPVFKHNLSEFVKLNKQDKFIFVEIYTYLNESTPLVFSISQRDDNIIIPKLSEYRKSDCFLKIGGFDLDKPNTDLDSEEEEEEEIEFVIRPLHKLSNLD